VQDQKLTTQDHFKLLQREGKGSVKSIKS